MTKPVVEYAFSSDVDVGYEAVVYYVIGHPRLGKQSIVYTSRVIKLLDDGFETLNTVYKLRKDDEDAGAGHRNEYFVHDHLASSNT